ncbi:MAG: hypothetical protein R3258_10905 [Acidimicrobiia bacterium]|nr:hypothetical protein [Acidimicrobiia bacterium]
MSVDDENEWREIQEQIRDLIQTRDQAHALTALVAEVAETVVRMGGDNSTRAALLAVTSARHIVETVPLVSAREAVRLAARKSEAASTFLGKLGVRIPKGEA